MIARLLLIATLWLVAATPASAASRVETLDIGLAADGTRIDAQLVEGSRPDAPTVVIVAGTRGGGATSSRVRDAVTAYARRGNRPVRLLAVPLANPDGAPMSFPPTGVAYRENPAAHTLWRWLGAQAPDLVLVADDDAAPLVRALESEAVAGMGRIPARSWQVDVAALARLGPLAKSEAHEALDRRRARTPKQFATALAGIYGQDFDQPWYIQALALVARARLGEVAAVSRLAEPWIDGTKNSLERPNALVMAGHIAFTELARRTGDPRYVAAVRKVADLGFDADGHMLEAMPYHERYSDSVFMGTVIAAQAGALTGERKYFDLADRHLHFMERLDRRADGLYRHRAPLNAAWGRGNGFAAIGLALTLPELPRDHPAHAHVLQSYRALMDALLGWQNRDGLWRNVVDHPGAFAEFSGTAMIGFALQRGLDRGWIKGRKYRDAAERAWLAVNSRTSAGGAFIDICESTAAMSSDADYLQRAAILGNDPRGGAMALLFATERMALSASK